MIDFPNSPTDGQVFTSGNSSWVWNAAASQWRTSLIALNPKVQRLSGDGTTVQFTLSSVPPNINFFDVYITGLYQQKNTYTLSGNVLTFSEAPPAGTENIEVEWGSSLDVGVPSDLAVSTAKLQDASVTPTKLSTGAPAWDVNGNVSTLAGLTVKTSDSNATKFGLKRSTLYNGDLTTGAIHTTIPTGWSDGGGIAIATMAGNNAGTASLVDRILIDDIGRVTTPSQPAFHAVGNSGQTNYGNGATFILAVTTSNVGNHYSTSTGRFTAPIAGFYVFHYGLYAYVTGQLAIKKNGSDWTPTDTSGLCTVQANTINSASVGISLNAGDYISIGWRTGSSGDVYMSHAWLTGYLLG